MLSHSVTAGPRSWFTLSGPEQDVILSSRVRFERNISGHFFLHRLDTEGVIALRRRVESGFSRMEGDYILIDGESISTDLRRCYQERGILLSGDLPLPAITNREEDRVVRIGPREHLVHESYTGGLDLFGSFERATEFDRELEGEFDFAVSLDRGYLLSDVTRTGTGLSAGLMMHLPGLVQSGGLGVVVADLDKELVTLHQYGSGEESLAHLFAATVPTVGGKGERELLMELEAFGQALVHYERAARADLFEAHRGELTEAAHRALGTLRFARRIALEESLELIDLLRFTVASGENVEGLALEKIDALLFHVQPGQVAVLAGSEGDTLENEDEKRALLIRSSLDRYLAQGD